MTLRIALKIMFGTQSDNRPLVPTTYRPATLQRAHLRMQKHQALGMRRWRRSRAPAVRPMRHHEVCPARLRTMTWEHSCDLELGHDGMHSAMEFGLDEGCHEAEWDGPVGVTILADMAIAEEP